MLEKFENQLYYVNRFGLDYKKLYHDFEGGYDLKKLTKVLERIKSDYKQGLHPFIDPDEDDRMIENLERVLKIRVEKGKAQKEKAEGEENEEEEEEEDGDVEKPRTFEDDLLDEVSDEEDREEMKELLKMVAEKKEREQAEDERDY